MPAAAQIDRQHMQRALTLARAAVGLASPNPTVGCVLAHGDRVVGEGAHRYDARDHAEVVALRAAGSNAHGATAYVTLEPCSHTGRTGPCAAALISSGISRVVIATADPNPLVAGRGISCMRAAGLTVDVGLCEREARALNNAFARFIQSAQPFVTLKSALSADGFLAPPPATRVPGQTVWLTGEDSRARVHLLRHAADALLTGIGTVLADDPALTDRSGLKRRRPLLRVILDSTLRLPLDSLLVTISRDDLLVLCSPAAVASREQALAARGVQIARIPTLADGSLDLRAALALLAARQITSVLAESGPALNSALLRAQLVDELILFHSPVLLGAGSIPFANGFTPAALESQLLHPTRQRLDDDLCVTGLLRDPWPNHPR
jgi:diaminohydroxyphosphoribosylaminopyrimidine deaminase/5-amino-6-(5-phosphoribosylamino)uracil reductase